MSAELVIYTDESTTKNHRFQNFYGGVLIRSRDLNHVESALINKVTALGITSEIKWTSITESWRDRYCELVDTIFDFVEQDKIKIRIMFTQTSVRAVGLTQEHHANQYWILYYQFLKHAFGLGYIDEFPDGVRVRLMLDQMPGTKIQRERFRDFVANLNTQRPIVDSPVRFVRDQISEVDSKKHILLQSLDLVLGAMHFRLNNLHLAIPPGKKRRGKRTRAKEVVYKHIQKRLVAIRPNFNIGISTGKDGEWENLWRHGYRHWLFTPTNREGE